MLERLKWFLDEPGRRIGKYEIVREVGRGGMGIVYEAVDPDLGRTVALKVLKTPDPERLRREAAAAAKLRHPNIVVVHEVGADHLAMEYVPGPTLAQAKLPPAESARVLETVARAVAAAHGQGVAHLDLKPGNVILGPGGRVVLTDFGLAGFREAAAGTPGYMAPEQAEGRGGPASDVWALEMMARERLGWPAPDPDPARRPTAAALADRLARRGKRGGRLLRLAAAFAVVLLAALAWRLGRGSAVRSVRTQAEIALEGALAVRRAGGSVAEMRRFLPRLEEAYRSAPGVAEVEHLMGRMHRALQDDAKALAFQERALALDPDHAGALYERAVLLSKRFARERQRAAEGPPPDLAPLRESILRDLRRLPGHHVAQGMLAYHLGKLEGARSILQDVVDKAPDLEEAWEALALVAGGEHAPGLAGRERRWLEAEEVLTRAIARDPGLLAHLFARASLRHERGSFRKDHGQDPLPDYAGAEEDLTRAIGIDPDSAEARMRRGLVRTQRVVHKLKVGADAKEDGAAALGDLSKAVELDPAFVSAWIWRGNVRFHLGDHEASERDFGEALRLAPGSADVLMRRGRLRSVCGRHEEAERDFAESLRLAPSNVWAWTWRGMARIRAGDPDGAEAHVTEAIRVERTHAEAWEQRGLARRARAAARERAGDRAGARRDHTAAAADLLEALTLNPRLEPSAGPPMRESQRKASELAE